VVTRRTLDWSNTYVLADAERRARTTARVQRGADVASELAAERQNQLGQLQPFIVATAIAALDGLASR
jgi:hypothetical protein